eukprot:14947066-Ditylum_brightwellii.AAC.1
MSHFESAVESKNDASYNTAEDENDHKSIMWLSIIPSKLIPTKQLVHIQDIFGAPTSAIFDNND